jgi:ferritin-like metal-binding protein YciE
MKFASLNDLYLHQLKDLYSAESQLIKALPKMALGSALQKAIDAERAIMQSHSAEVAMWPACR